MDALTEVIVARGDLAHFVLFLWAMGSSGLLVWALKELAAANKRFNEFVTEIANLNRLFRRGD